MTRFKIFFLLLIVFNLSRAQEEVAPLTAEEIAVATDTIIAHYSPEWQELSMQGKLTFDGLPVRPTVKIYMERGKSVIMSARASILGEVARVEIDRDSVTLINKHSKTYTAFPIGTYLKDYPGGICDIQDILLGQIAIPGAGRLTQELAQRAQWIGIPEQGTLIYPEKSLQFSKSDYGFVADPDDWHLKAFALGLPEAEAFLETGYLYGEDGWTLGLKITLRDKPMQGEMQLSYPDYAPTPLQPTDAGARYRKVDIKQLLKF